MRLSWLWEEFLLKSRAIYGKIKAMQILQISVKCIGCE